MIFSKSTKKQIDNLLVKPPHAIILVSKSNKEAKEIIDYLIRKILHLADSYNLENYPYIVEVHKDKNTVAVDDLRVLEKSFKLKVPSKKTISRFAIIFDAELMNQISQNTMLKILEEPPEDSIIILVTKSASQINKTLQSRAVIVSINKLDFDQFSEKHKEKLSTKADLKKYYIYSDGESSLENNDSFDFDLI